MSRERHERGATKKVGEILVDAGLIDEKQLALALAEQRKSGARLGNILTELGLASDAEISRALAEQSGLDYVDLDKIEVSPKAIDLIPESVARRLGCMPLRVEAGALVVAMSNPTDIVAIDELQRRTDHFVQVVSAGQRQLQRAIERGYGGTGAAAGVLDLAIERALAEFREDEDRGAQGGLIALVNELIATALRQDATDLHFQPEPQISRVRLRIDGDLVQAARLDSELHAPIVSRIKVMANLDISETRTPQDGKVRFPHEGGVVDLRVSTFPSVTGESVVVRILDKDSQLLRLTSLGFDEHAEAILRNAVQRPNGLILTVGPTGSGKSTTLHALLRTVNSSRRKIITIEDPVEYEVPMVTQCQVNERAGLTFASSLRAVLRHDPDIILIGEIRDLETASLALRAALTGHLVLSTLHTNDAVRTISRLRDMELDSYLISSCLVAVAAQRLVRRICSHCSEPYTPRPDELAAVGLPADTVGSFARGRGCDRCAHSGAKGREAIFEILEVTPPVAQQISRNAPPDVIEAAARECGLVTFHELALQRALEGRISLEDVARIGTEAGP